MLNLNNIFKDTSYEDNLFSDEAKAELENSIIVKSTVAKKLN